MKKIYLTIMAALFSAVSFAQTSLKEVNGFRVLKNTVFWGKNERTGSAERFSKFKYVKSPSPLAISKLFPKAHSASDILTEQPAGKLYSNLYQTAKGFGLSAVGLAYGALESFATDYVVADDGSAFLKDPYSSLVTNSWLKGVKAEGDTVEFKLPQPIYHEEYEGEDYLFYASRMVLDAVWSESDQDTILTYVPDTVTQTVKFVWRNDSLIKQGDCLLGLVDEGGVWVGYGDDSLVLNVLKDKPAFPANPNVSEDYTFVFNNNAYFSSDG